MENLWDKEIISLAFHKNSNSLGLIKILEFWQNMHETIS